MSKPFFEHITNSAGFIEKRIEAIQRLRYVKKHADPASGISFQVRQGVFNDESAAEKRPIIKMETADLELGHKVIDLLIESELDSLRRTWVPETREKLQYFASVLEDYDKFTALEKNQLKEK